MRCTCGIGGGAGSFHHYDNPRCELYRYGEKLVRGLVTAKDTITESLRESGMWNGDRREAFANTLIRNLTAAGFDLSDRPVFPPPTPNDVVWETDSWWLLGRAHQ